MEFRFFTCLGVMLLVQVMPTNSCSCKKATPPLNFIFQIVPHFKEVHACGRKCFTSFGASDDGVRRIHYRFELNKNESAIDLCSCVYDYLSQKDWLDGSTQHCCVRKSIATLTVEGKPDSTFKEDNPTSDDPVEQLKNIFDQFRSAEIIYHQCRPNTRRDKYGVIHFEVQCDLRPDSPCKEEMCDGILQYLNQDKWLGELTAKCTSDGNILDMEIMGK